MKKRLLITSTFLAVFAFSLTSCNKETYVPSKVLRCEYNNDFYNVGIKGEGRKSLSFTVETETDSNGELDTYRAVTDVNVLVVPIDFTDYRSELLPGGAENARHQIEVAHFGDPEEDLLYSESLASYYYKSSLGVANISGTVADWYHTGMSVTQFAKYSGGGTGATLQLTTDIQEYMRNEYETYEDDKEGYLATHDNKVPLNLKDFDANKDGYVDALIMIYSCPPRVAVNGKYVDNELFWAYTSQRPGAFGTVSKPAFFGYFWTSIETFYEAGYYDDNNVHHEWTDDDKANGTVAIDCHTLIHEFGHILGLPDYYSYDANKGASDYYPMGGVDMMDFNVGDHNMMSKAWYGWVAPYVVEKSCTLTIGSSTTTGDFIILPVKGTYSGSLIDQYVMIEFLTNEGVGVVDAEHRLVSLGSSSYPLWYSKIGIRVTLVDARLGVFNYDSTSGSFKFAGYTINFNDNGNNSYVAFAHDNTKSRSAYPNYRFIELISRTGVATSKLGRDAGNDDLFVQGDKFSSIWPKYMVNGVTGIKDVRFAFDFTVKTIDPVNKTATISFKKL